MIIVQFLLPLSIFLFITLIKVYYIKIKEKKLVEKYFTDNSKNFKNKPLMIIGPSGVGKDSFIQLLINKYPNKFIKCVSCTTRAPRNNEKEGVNYYFITKEKYQELEENGEILGKFEKYNNLYGTSKKILNNILSNDKIVYFDYNIETAIKTFKESNIEFNYIALLPPSIEELKNRLEKRGTESKESIKKRISYAYKEIELINKSKFLNYIVINDVLDKAFNEFEENVKKLYSSLFK